MIRATRPVRIVAVTLAVAAGALSPTFAQDAPIDLAGKTVRLLVAGSTGGYTDLSGRTFARHVQKYLPGEPEIVVQNINGGGGLAMLRHFLAIDPKEEIAVAMVNSNLPFRARAGLIDTADFDPRAVQWVGSFNETANTCMVSSAIGVDSIDDLRDREITVGATGRSSGSYGQYAMLMRGLNLKLRPILGYDTTAAMGLAIERGELDGLCVSRPSMELNMGPMIAAGTVRPILYVAPYPIDDLSHISYLFDLEMSEDERAFLMAAHNSVAFGRPLAMLAGADSALVEVMRDALAASIRDEQMHQEFGAAGGYVHLTTGPRVQDAVDALYAMPDDLVAEIADMYYGDD